MTLHSRFLLEKMGHCPLSWNWLTIVSEKENLKDLGVSRLLIVAIENIVTVSHYVRNIIPTDILASEFHSYKHVKWRCAVSSSLPRVRRWSVLFNACVFWAELRRQRPVRRAFLPSRCDAEVDNCFYSGHSCADVVRFQPSPLRCRRRRIKWLINLITEHFQVPGASFCQMVFTTAAF